MLYNPLIDVRQSGVQPLWDLSGVRSAGWLYDSCKGARDSCLGGSVASTAVEEGPALTADDGSK